MAELDETIESMQSTIFSLQMELAQTKQTLARYVQECVCLPSVKGAKENSDGMGLNQTAGDYQLH